MKEYQNDFIKLIAEIFFKKTKTGFFVSLFIILIFYFQKLESMRYYEWFFIIILANVLSRFLESFGIVIICTELANLIKSKISFLASLIRKKINIKLDNVTILKINPSFEKLLKDEGFKKFLFFIMFKNNTSNKEHAKWILWNAGEVSCIGVYETFIEKGHFSVGIECFQLDEKDFSANVANIREAFYCITEFDDLKITDYRFKERGLRVGETNSVVICYLNHSILDELYRYIHTHNLLELPNHQ